MMNESASLAVKLWLVRHGQTDWNTQRRFQGQTDIPLNTTGIEQARNLSAKLNENHIKAIYSSDLSRAMQTASILAQDRNLPVIPDERLREINMGSWEGRTWQDVNQNLSPEMMELMKDPVNSRAPGGESVAEVAVRAASFADDIGNKHPGELVLVVSHGLTLGTLHCMAKGLPLLRARDLIPENCSITQTMWNMHD